MRSAICDVASMCNCAGRGRARIVAFIAGTGKSLAAVKSIRVVIRVENAGINSGNIIAGTIYRRSAGASALGAGFHAVAILTVIAFMAIRGPDNARIIFTNPGVLHGNRTIAISIV